MRRIQIPRMRGGGEVGGGDLHNEKIGGGDGRNTDSENIF